MNDTSTKTNRPRDRRETNRPRDRREINLTGLEPRVVVGKWHLTECLNPSGSDVLVFIESYRPIHTTKDGILNGVVDKFTGKAYVPGRDKPMQMMFGADGYEWYSPFLLRGPIYVATDHEVLLWRARQELENG